MSTSSTPMCISGEPFSRDQPAAQVEDLRADAAVAQRRYDVELLELGHRTVEPDGRAQAHEGERHRRCRRPRRAPRRCRRARAAGRSGPSRTSTSSTSVSNSVLKSHSSRASTSASAAVARRTSRHRRLVPAGQAVAGEEVVQQRRRLGGEHAGHDLGPVVEAAVADHVPERADGAQLVVVRPEDEAVDPGEHEGAGAHRARLEGDDEGAAGEPPLTAGGGGGAQRDDLGVPGRVALGLAGVAARADDRAGLVEHDGADRYVVTGEGGLRLGEGEAHGLVPGHGAHAEVRPTASSKRSPKPRRLAMSDSTSSG